MCRTVIDLALFSHPQTCQIIDAKRDYKTLFLMIYDTGARSSFFDVALNVYRNNQKVPRALLGLPE